MKGGGRKGKNKENYDQESQDKMHYKEAEIKKNKDKCRQVKKLKRKEKKKWQNIYNEIK